MRASLKTIIASRIAAVAALAILLQFGVVAFNYYFDDRELAQSFVRREAEALAAGVTILDGKPSFSLPKGAIHYLREHADAYSFRILDENGHTIAAKNEGLIVTLSPWPGDGRIVPDSWFRRDHDNSRLHIAGGERIELGGTAVRVEFATLGDPESVYWRVIYHETVDHVWVPMIPLILLVLIVVTWSLQRSLRPVSLAARQADAIDPLDPSGTIDVSDMPSEVASFASAINRTIARVRDLVGSQKIFVASAAHELRTPLAVMTLELGNIDHPRARRLEKDVEGMAHKVNQLLTIARLDAAGSPDFSEVDLGAMARECVDRLQPLARAKEQVLELVIRSPGRVRGDRGAIADALRNLIENAFKHTPVGTHVRVSVGPGGRIGVDDSGPGIDAEAAARLFEPFRKGDGSDDGAGLGLSIVKRIADLHKGSVDVHRSDLGGTGFELRFPEHGLRAA